MSNDANLALETNMPLAIKGIIAMLVMSLLATLTAVYLEGESYEGMGFGNALISGTNFIWSLVIVWMITDLIRKRDIQLSLLFVSVIMLASIVWDYIEFGIEMSLIFYILELLLFIISYFVIKTSSCKNWLKPYKT